jgi:hypothetical protein
MRGRRTNYGDPKGYRLTVVGEIRSPNHIAQAELRDSPESSLGQLGVPTVLFATKCDAIFCHMMHYRFHRVEIPAKLRRSAHDDFGRGKERHCQCQILCG